MPLRPHQYIEVAFVGRSLDGAVEIKFLRRPRAGKFAKATQREFDIACTEFDVVIEIFKFSLVPDFDSPKIAIGFLPDANTFRIVAIGAKRGRSGGANPLGSPLMASLLFGQTFAQSFEQFVQASHGLDLLLLFFGQIFFRKFLQPVGRYVGIRDLFKCFKSLEDMPEYAIEFVEVALVFNQGRARQIIKVFDLRDARSASSACISVRYSRRVTGTPADFNSLKKVTNIGSEFAL